jgi:hypothetical protein
VEHDERRLDVGVEEVGIEGGQPVRGGERLVRDGREAAGGDVHVAVGGARERVDAAPHPVSALLRARRIVCRRRAEHRLEDARTRVARVVPSADGSTGTSRQRTTQSRSRPQASSTAAHTSPVDRRSER